MNFLSCNTVLIKLSGNPSAVKDACDYLTENNIEYSVICTDSYDSDSIKSQVDLSTLTYLNYLCTSVHSKGKLRLFIWDDGKHGYREYYDLFDWVCPVCSCRYNRKVPDSSLSYCLSCRSVFYLGK